MARLGIAATDKFVKMILPYNEPCPMLIMPMWLYSGITFLFHKECD
jgi:hypothetical protein